MNSKKTVTTNKGRDNNNDEMFSNELIKLTKQINILRKQLK